MYISQFLVLLYVVGRIFPVKSEGLFALVAIKQRKS